MFVVQQNKHHEAATAKVQAVVHATARTVNLEEVPLVSPSPNKKKKHKTEGVPKGTRFVKPVIKQIKNVPIK